MVIDVTHSRICKSMIPLCCESTTHLTPLQDIILLIQYIMTSSDCMVCIKKSEGY